MQFESNTHELSKIFNEVKPVRGFEDIVIQIQDAIVGGQLKAGDKLPNERDLGAVFGVSRPTLREAIRVLEADGVVVVRRGTNGGSFIAEPKPDQVGHALEALIRFHGATIVELAEFRAGFEPDTAYWAAKRASSTQVKHLLEIAAEFRGLAEFDTVPWSRLVDLDIAFHEEVARSSQNQIRVAIMLAVHGVLHKTEMTIEGIQDLPWRQQQASDLEQIAVAISKRQFRIAKRLMKEHVLRNVEVEVVQNTQNERQPIHGE